MNITQSISKREKGLRFRQDYDITLLRLRCYNEDVYKGIAPNINAPDFNPEPPVLACRFSNTPGYEEVIALGNEDGKIALQDTTIKQNSNSPLEGTQAHSDAVFDIAWMPQEMKLITASGDHSARLWNVSSSEITGIQTFQAHTRSIKSAVFRYQDKAVFATGARDGAIMIWDIRANYNDRPKPDNSIYNAHCTNISNRTRLRKTSYTSRQNHSHSITGLVFQDDYTLLSCSAGDGLIKVWDIRKNYTIHKKDPIAKHIMNYSGKSNSNGFTSLLMCPAGITLYASCMDNTIYAYNISSYNCKPIAEYYGHKNSTFYVKACLSADGKYLASGSSDESAYIWHTSKPGTPLLKLIGHRDEVTCIAWCSVNESKIVTCSDDSCHRIWRIGPEYISEDEKINLHGYAESIPQLMNCHMDISTLEKTPTAFKSRLSTQYSSESDITPGNTPNPGSSENIYENVIGSLKRSYAQMSNDYWLGQSYKPILSSIQESHEAPAKRAHIDNRGARRLFSPGNKELCVKSVTEEQTNVDHKTDKFGPSTSRKLDLLVPFSPTSNLPNFVIDGTAPHLLEMSPQKSKENVDWLTKIRKERYAQRGSKSTEKLSSQKTHTTPVRRTSRSRSTEPRKTPKKPANLLLQFFRPTIKSCDDDLHLRSTNISYDRSSAEMN